MSEDQGSVGPLAAPSVPSPSLATEPATRSTGYGVVRRMGWDDNFDPDDNGEGGRRAFLAIVEFQDHASLGDVTFTQVWDQWPAHIVFSPPEGVAIKPAADGEVRDAHSAPNDRTQDHPPGGHSHEG